MDKDNGAQELFKHPLPLRRFPLSPQPCRRSSVLTQFVTACLGMQEVGPSASGYPHPNISPYLALHRVGAGAVNPLHAALDFCQDIDKGRTQLCHKEEPPESEATGAAAGPGASQEDFLRGGVK